MKKEEKKRVLYSWQEYFQIPFKSVIKVNDQCSTY